MLEKALEYFGYNTIEEVEADTDLNQTDAEAHIMNMYKMCIDDEI